MLILIENNKIQKIFKEDDPEGIYLLNVYNIVEDFFKDGSTMDFSPVRFRFEKEEDFKIIGENSFCLGKNITYLLEIILPEYDDEDYYKDCLLLAKSIFQTCEFHLEKDFNFETILHYGEGTMQ